MKKWWLAIAVLIIMSAAASAECYKPLNSKEYNYDRKFCSSTFKLPDGISIGRDGILIDCNNAVLQGNFKGTGITVKNRNNVVIKNCNLANYATGIYLQNCTNTTIYRSTLMRNYVGIKAVSSSYNFFDENQDISLEKPLKLTESYNNTIRFINKDIEDDFCRYNKCNTQSNMAQEDGGKETLVNLLKSAIQEWIS